MQEKSAVRPLFRENAIKNFHSIDDIEATLEIINPRAWIVVLSSLLLFIGILIWAIFGRISMNVMATGILLPEEQLRKTERLIAENIHIRNEKLDLLKKLLDEKKDLYRKHYLTLNDLEKSEEEYLSAKEDKYGSPNAYSANHNFPLVPGMMKQPNAELNALVFVKHSQAKKVFVGMDAYVLPTIISSYEYGYIKGKVVRISAYPVSKESVYSYLGNMSLVEEFFASGVPFIVEIHLEKNAENKSGLAWTSKQSPAFKIEAGTTVTAKIVNKELSPIKLLESHV